MRVVVLGMPCAATIAAVRAMQAAGIEIAAIVVARAAGAAGVTDWGNRAGFGLSEGAVEATLAPVSRMLPDAAAAIARARPDVIVTACFPWRLPPAVLDLPPLGCLNIHPSLLPRGRGPDPVFWTYRRGERETGVTVHLMDTGFDTGPILAQHQMEVPAGSRAPALDQALMARGGQLVAQLLPRLGRGTVAPIPRDESRATLAPNPGAADYEISTSWSAERAYTFAYGVAPLPGPIAVRIEATGERIPVQDALDFAVDEPMAADVVDEGRGVARVRFGPGWARFLRADVARYPLSLSPISARDIR